MEVNWQLIADRSARSVIVSQDRCGGIGTGPHTEMTLLSDPRHCNSDEASVVDVASVVEGS